jgi:hypothetical protein
LLSQYSKDCRLLYFLRNFLDFFSDSRKKGIGFCFKTIGLSFKTIPLSFKTNGFSSQGKGFRPQTKGF